MPPFQIDLLIHSTHEAGWKVGGIGAVLDGLLNQPAYTGAVKRTLLVGPYHAGDPLEQERLHAPQNRFKARFSSLDHIAIVAPEIANALDQIELHYSVRILYGTRLFGAQECEILLVDPTDAEPAPVADLKYHLWKQYGIDSYAFEQSREYDWYIRAAEPSIAAIQAVAGMDPAPLGGTVSENTRRAVLIAHDWLGLPLALAARRRQPNAFRLVYYAHEVAAARVLVEWHPGHDTRFYNVLERAHGLGLSLEQVFGSESASFKYALFQAAAGFDGFFGVSDLILDELRFLSPTLARRPLALVYNGVPSPTVTLRDKQASKARLREYARALLGFKPSWIMTHVTRLVPSKAVWRDLRVMEKLDRLLAARGETAVLLTLATSSPAGKRIQDVVRWESEYDWPVQHRTGNGDLVSFEVDYYNALEQFNRTSRASKVVLINQFGFGRERCGTRVPADIEPGDIRRGTDLEFGQSIYEPFGIGQLEPLAAGALCCLSNVCGCVGFIKQVQGLDAPNVLVTDNVTLPRVWGPLDLQALLQIGQVQRDEIEKRQAALIARDIVSRLPRSSQARKRLLDEGQALSRQMSWSVVVEKGLVPALEKLFV